MSPQEHICEHRLEYSWTIESDVMNIAKDKEESKTETKEKLDIQLALSLSTSDCPEQADYKQFQ
jgi:hypothetical protein